MESIWQSPEFWRAGVIPFAVGLVLAIALRLIGGRETGGRFAVLAMGVGFLVAYYLLEGLTWPPVQSKEKVVYIIAALLAAGVLSDLIRLPRGVAAVAGLLLYAAGVYWLAGSAIARGPDTELILKLGGLLIAAVIVFGVLAAIGEDAPLDDTGNHGRIQAPTLVLLTAFAGGVISLSGAFIGMALLLLALGAALGGVLLLSYFAWVTASTPLRFGAIGILGGGGAWLVGVAVMVIFGGSVDLFATGALLLTYLLGFWLRRMELGFLVRGRLLSPILYGIITAVPAVAAVAYVILTAEPGSGY